MTSQPPAAPGATRMLIACIGNIFLGDDGFGVEVARRLATRRYPAGVAVVDFGIRGVELAYTLLDGCETLVLVDAVPRGGAPGTLYVIEPDAPASAAAPHESHAEPAGTALDAHSMDPMKTLAFAYRLGARPGLLLLVGCEPDTPPTTDEDVGLRMGLSAPVQAAVEEAAMIVDRLVAQFCAPGEGAAEGARARETERETEREGEASWVRTSQRRSE